ncbi:hypothetical protein C4572_04220 [Candidatus Parcubacteria bacterium]|nr:MAG: hypothetical protein C4572_04220 [Candidatus Parcubacteria bacterium]
MSPLQEEKIRKILGSAKSFAIVCDNDAPEESMLAKEALAAAIKNNNIPSHCLPERRKEFVVKWETILPKFDDLPLLFSTSILIPKNRIDTKEISYTEDSRFVSININSGKEEITKENVVFKTTPLAVDGIFYFAKNSKDTPEESIALEDFAKKISIPEKDKIISVATEAGETISEKVFDIIQVMESSGSLSTASSPVPDLLLASLLTETDHFHKALNEKTLSLAASLIRLGANKKKVTDLMGDKTLPFTRLLGRALARSYPNESLKSMWIFIADQDLEKTSCNPDIQMFKKIIQKAKNILPPHPFFILVWQYKEEVWAIISTESPYEQSADKIRLSTGAKMDGNAIISGPYKNFSEAELQIQNALKENLA